MAVAHSFGNAMNFNFHGAAETLAFVCSHGDRSFVLRGGFCGPAARNRYRGQTAQKPLSTASQHREDVVPRSMRTFFPKML